MNERRNVRGLVDVGFREEEEVNLEKVRGSMMVEFGLDLMSGGRSVANLGHWSGLGFVRFG